MTTSAEFLGGITSYSGSDIEVVAFRDLSVLNGFRLDSIRKERKEIEAHSQRLSNDLAQARLKADARAGASQRLASEGTISSINIPTTGALTATPNQFGMSPNQLDRRTAQAAESEVEIKNIVEGQRQNQTRISELRAEEARIKSDTGLNSLGMVHTISYSSFREKFAVRTLGKVQAKGYTAGPRTVAGTMVFNVVQEHELMKLAGSVEDSEGSHPRALLLDQLDSFNLMLVFSNEYGSYSIMILFDVTIQSEGQNMSVEEIITKNTMNFYATDIVPLTPVGNLFDTYDAMLAAVIKESGGSPVMKSNKASYRISSRLEKLASSQASKDLDQEIGDMLSESRGLF